VSGIYIYIEREIEHGGKPLFVSITFSRNKTLVLQTGNDGTRQLSDDRERGTRRIRANLTGGSCLFSVYDENELFQTAGRFARIFVRINRNDPNGANQIRINEPRANIR